MAREFITASNYSLLVLTVNWFTCAIAVISIVARGIAKVTFRRAISLDDYSSCLSIVSLAKSPYPRILIQVNGCPLASRHCSVRYRYYRNLKWARKTHQCTVFDSSLSLLEGQS